MNPLFLLLLSLTATHTVHAEPGSPAAVVAVIEQEVLPALEARRLGALARRDAAQAWLDGTGDWVGAFPEWQHLSLLDAATVVAARAGLADRAARRAAERVALPAEALDAATASRLAAATAAACDAEDGADQLAARFLAGLTAGLQAHPELQAAALGRWADEQRAASESTRAALLARPSDPDLQAAVAQADSLQGLHRALAQALIGHWTVPGHPGLADWLEGALVTPVDDPGLWVPLLPLLDGAQADAVTARLQARGDRARATELAELAAQVAELTQALDDPPAHEDADPADLEVSLARAELAVDLALAAAAEAADPERGALELRRAQLERDLVRARLTAAQDGLARETVSDEDAAQAADAATQAAAQAQARVEAAGARGRDATLEVRLKEQRDQVALVRQTDLVLRQQAREVRDRLSLALDEVRDLGAGARAKPNLSPERQPALDSAYRAARRLTHDVRTEVRTRQTALASWRETMRRLDADLASFDGVDPGDKLAADWSGASQDLHKAMDDRRDREIADLDRALALLARARTERAELRTLASQDLRDEDNRAALEELTTEATEIPVHLGAVWRRATGALALARSTVGDLAAVQRFLAGLAGTLVLLGVWVLVRPRIAELLQSVVQEARAGTRRRWTGDLTSLVRPVAPVLALGGDALVTAILLAGAGGRWPVFQVILWAFLVRRLAQTVPQAVGLSIAAPHESRPALMVSTPEVRDLFVLSARWLTLWWGGLAVIDAVVADLLQAERIAQWLSSAGDLAGLGLAAYLLWRWGPTVERGVRATEDPNAFVAWLGRDEGGFTLQAVRAVVGSGWLLITWLGRLLDSREGTSWIGAVLARRHLSETAGQGRLAPPPETLDAIRDTRVPLEQRTDALERVRRQIKAWRHEGVDGLVAVLGDRGTGKGHFLEAAVGLATNSLPAEKLQPPESHLTGDDGLAWLCEATGVPVSRVLDEVVAGLLARDPALWLFDDLHRLFVRRVGGFVALNDVLVVLRRTAHHHFWVVTCHGPTWNYLAGVRERVPLAAFQAVIRLEALAPEPLAAWLLARTEAAGLRPDFSGLSNAATLGGEPTLALQRATTAYWRLLTDTSEGNPQVAFELFLSSLYGGRGASPLGVGLPPVHGQETLDALADSDLFVLAALIVHDGLTLQILTDVLNVPPERVRATCSTLLTQGVLTAAETEAPWYVAPGWRPAVHRLLRQKHVLRGRL